MARHCLCAFVTYLCLITIFAESINQSNNELNELLDYFSNQPSSIGCVTCDVTACKHLIDDVITIQLPKGNPNATTSDPCSLLNQAISKWMPRNEHHPNDLSNYHQSTFNYSSDPTITPTSAFGLCDLTSHSPNAEIGELACEQVVVMNQTAAGCLIPSMSQDPSFSRTCKSLTQCDVSQGDMLIRADACRSSTNFIKSLIFDAAIPSGSHCSTCTIDACQQNDVYLDVVFQVSDQTDAQLGNTCDSLKAGIAELINSPADPACQVSRRQAANATCWPLYYASLKAPADQDKCSLSSLLYQYYDTLHYEQLMVSRSAFMWPSVCPRYLTSTFNAATAAKLQALGFCNSPTNGLLAFSAQFNAGSNDTIGSSSTGQAATNSGSTVTRQAGGVWLTAVLAVGMFIYF